MSQLFILESVSADRITASMSARDELKRMERDAINLDPGRKNSIISCNIRSIKKNFDSFISSSATKRANVMCLQETWLDPLDSTSNCNMLPENTGWKQHNNNVGKGKGITTFFTEKYKWEQDITNPSYQMTKITSDTLEIINVYRSRGAETENLLKDLFTLIGPGKQTLVLGDFNLCYLTESFHLLFQAFRRMGYQQIVVNPTSINGRLIDLAFISPSALDVFDRAQQQSQFFTDHDLIEIIEGALNFLTQPITLIFFL